MDADRVNHLIEFDRAFDRVNHCHRNVPMHIVKLFIFWYREQEFMVRWGNSLSMTFRCEKWDQARGTVIPIVV